MTIFLVDRNRYFPKVQLLILLKMSQSTPFNLSKGLQHLKKGISFLAWESSISEQCQKLPLVPLVLTFKSNFKNDFASNLPFWFLSRAPQGSVFKLRWKAKR